MINQETEIAKREEELQVKAPKMSWREKITVTKMIGVVALVIVIAFVAQYFVLTHRASVEQQALQQKIEELKNKMDHLEVTKEVKVSNATLREVLVEVGKLTTYEYYYSDIGTYEKSKMVFNFKVPFTTDKTIYAYTGVIGLGVDVGKVDFDVNEAEKVITVSMPAPQILSHTSEENGFQFYDVKNSIFTSTNLGEFNEFELTLKKNQEEKLLEKKSVWAGVKKNAEMILTNMITLSGKIEGYTLQYQWVEK